MEKIVQIFNSFEEQEKSEKKYWQNISGEKKLKILEYIRMQYWALNNETSPELQRVYRTTERV